MTSYLVTIETCLKMRARDKQTATVKTSDADVLWSWKKIKKPQRRVATHPPPLHPPFKHNLGIHCS